MWSDHRAGITDAPLLIWKIVCGVVLSELLLRQSPCQRSVSLSVYFILVALSIKPGVLTHTNPRVFQFVCTPWVTLSYSITTVVQCSVV